MNPSTVSRLQLVGIETGLHGIREPLVRYATADHRWFKYLRLEPTLIVAKPSDRISMVLIPRAEVLKFAMPLIVKSL